MLIRDGKYSCLHAHTIQTDQIALAADQTDQHTMNKDPAGI